MKGLRELSSLVVMNNLFMNSVYEFGKLFRQDQAINYNVEYVRNKFIEY